MFPILDSCLNMKKECNPSKILIISDNFDLIKSTYDSIKDIPLIIATNNRPSREWLIDDNIKIKRLAKQPAQGIDVLRQVKDLIVASCAEGLLTSKDKVLCLISTNIDTLVSFDVQKLGVASLRDLIKDRLDIRILETVMNIASKIVIEGKEGYPAGALFVIGDSDKVMKNSTQRIINPFHGHEAEGCYLLNEKNWNTIKHFATLDGATIIDSHGYAIAAGRYIINLNLSHYLEGGLGGRHLAGLSITERTKAISVVVSQTGIIRIYMEGSEIYRVDSH